MNNGWIKIHRKIEEKGYYKNSAYVHLWVHLLLLANHEDGKEFLMNGKICKLKAGQFVTGRVSLSEATGIPQTTIERVLSLFEREGQIGQQKTTKYRVITIINWEKHQKVDNKRTTNGQQTDTIKNLRIKEEDTEAGTSPAKGKKKVTYNPLGAEILKAFEEVDPKNKTYYGNKTQRSSCDFLIGEYGLGDVLRAIKILPKINQQKLYIKQITTPYELKENWVKIGNALRQKKGEKVNKTTPNFIL